MSRGRRSTRDMFIRAVRRSGHWFPERGCILEHQIFRFAEMILPDRCSISWPGITFSWQAQYFRQVEWKNCKTHWYEAVSSALNCPFLKEVSQNCFVFDLTLPTSKIAEVSQDCLVCDVVKFTNFGGLAELLRFWCCQVQKLRTSRRVALFSSLQTDRQTDRQTDGQTDRQTDRQIDR